MGRLKQTLRGSTLAETLVMMIVAGIVFLSVMDGMTLFTRLQTQRIEALAANGQLVDGYFRAEMLIAAADSLCGEGPELILYSNGSLRVLALRDSALIVLAEGFRDTLMTGIGAFRLAGYIPQAPDTVEIAVHAAEREFTVKFPAPQASAKQYERALEQIEQTYGYEE